MPRSRLLYYPSIFLWPCAEREREKEYLSKAFSCRISDAWKRKIATFWSIATTSAFSFEFSVDSNASNKGGSFANISRSESRSRLWMVVVFIVNNYALIANFERSSFSHHYCWERFQCVHNYNLELSLKSNYWDLL